MKIKNRLLLILAIFLLFPITVSALKYPKIDSKIVEIYDLTDKKVIYEIDSKKKSSIASLTKIVTTITAIETIKDLDEEVIITKEILDTVRWDASTAGLKVGDKLTYRDLLYASMLPSGADATNAIAISSSGSIENYVKKMNELVDKLGLTNTHFVNVTGLDIEGHYSTADEVRQILEYALKNPLFKEIYTTFEYKLSNGLTVKSTINKYSGKTDKSKILGSKTGFTKEAGYCLSSLSNINSHDFLIIVLQAEHIDNNYYNIIDTVNLIQFLLDNYEYRTIINEGDIIKTIPIKLSKEETYDIKTLEEIKLFLPSDYDKEKVQVKYEGLEELSFLNKKGDKIGNISYYYDNELLFQDDVLLEYKINMSIPKIIINYYYILIIIIVLIVLIVICFKKRKHKKRH